MASTTATPTRSPLPERSSPGVVVPPTVDAVRTCGCGQALDNSHARHCPRCGVAVPCPPVVAPGRWVGPNAASRHGRLFQRGSQRRSGSSR
jgi:hypothetical protein